MVQAVSPENAFETKAALREKINSLMKALAPKDIGRMSARIAETLFSLKEYRESQKVLVYLALKSEAQTERIVQKSFEDGKRVFVPVVDRENDELFISELPDLKINLVKGAYGILEPAEIDRKITAPEIIDLAIVPGLAFDGQGARLGHGKGYYDRLLKRLSPHALRLGLAFGCQILPSIPYCEHDVRVHKVLTESETLNCFDPEGV